jgi:FKBP-type peptidyl-prolyl cis-trans isomerase
MTAVVATLAVLGCGTFCSAAEPEAQPDKGLKTEAERLGYAIGLTVGGSLKRLQAEIDLEALKLGVQDTLADKKPRLTQKQMAEVLEKMQDAHAKRMEELPEKNRKKGEAFLAANGKLEDVTTTKSGLQYKVLKRGAGASPKATDRVKVHYRGTLIDGTEFDSSYKRGQPATFAANRVIAGWTEALQLMKIGGKYRLFIPADLAYGKRGAGQTIGPNCTLIFEVELLDIVTPDASAQKK